jgi:hypothetical protein
MRQTCARVLAAALMTGAIATAMGLPSLFESGGDPGHGLTAPPSSLQRSVRSPALLAPARPSRAERRPASALSRERTTGAGAGPSRPALTAALSNPRPGGLTGKSPVPAPVPKPEPKPAPAPAPPPAPAAEPETRELSGSTPVPAPTTAAPEPRNDKKKSKGKDPGDGNGKDNGGGKDKEKPADRDDTAASPGADCPDTVSAAEPKGQSEDDRRGHEKGHDKHDGKDGGKGNKD